MSKSFIIFLHDASAHLNPDTCPSFILEITISCTHSKQKKCSHPRMK